MSHAQLLSRTQLLARHPYVSPMDALVEVHNEETRL
jgi:hypothetical protein